MSLLAKMFSAFIISCAFGALFGVRGKNVLFAGFCGFVSGSVYLLSVDAGNLFALVAASTCMALCCEILARVRKCPTTIFQIAGLIPLVPGGRIYTTMQLALSGLPGAAAMEGYGMLLEAGAMAIGIILVSSLAALRRKAKTFKL